MNSKTHPVHRFVEEIGQNIAAMNEQRETLRALGIPLRTTRTLVELGVQEQSDEQARVLQSAMALSTASEGSYAIGREELERRIANLVQLERDLSHTRRLVREQGYDAQVISFLTQIIEQNPGDRGKRVANTFVDYARACGIEFNGLSAVASPSKAKKESVLPDITRPADAVPDGSGRRLIQDVIISLAIGLGILWLVI